MSLEEKIIFLEIFLHFTNDIPEKDGYIVWLPVFCLATSVRRFHLNE